MVDSVDGSMLSSMSSTLSSSSSSLSAAGAAVATASEANAAGGAISEFTGILQSLMASLLPATLTAGTATVKEALPTDTESQVDEPVPEELTADVPSEMSASAADILPQESESPATALPQTAMASSLAGNSLPLSADSKPASELPSSVSTMAASRNVAMAYDRWLSLTASVAEASSHAVVSSSASESSATMLSSPSLPTVSEALTAALADDHIPALLPDAELTVPVAMTAHTSSGADAGTAVARHTLAVPVSHPYWPQALAGTVSFLAAQNMQKASLHLQPPELGPLNITLQLDQGAANVSFVTHNASVQESIAGSLGTLRELLAQQGLSLGNVEVSQQQAGLMSSGQQEQQAGRDRQEDGSAYESAPDGESVEEPLRVTMSVADINPHRIDHYA